MAVEIVNTSVRPDLPQTLPYSNSEFQGALPSFLSSWSAWQYIVIFLLGVVVYDQGNQECRVRGMLHPANAVSSHVHQAKRSDRWTYIQDSAHGTIYPGTLSKVRSISCTVGEWASQLRIRLPQVCPGSVVISSGCNKFLQAPLLIPDIADSSSSSPTETSPTRYSSRLHTPSHA